MPLTLDGVARRALALPEVEEGERHDSQRIWSVRGKTFAWERSFSKADVKRFGDEPVPEGPILAIRTADLNEKEAVLAAGSAGLLTIPHFDGYAAVLVQLKFAPAAVVAELLVDGWRACAPAALAASLSPRSRR